MILPDYRKEINRAADKLASQFEKLNWDFRPTLTGGKEELISQWLGEPEEDIMVVCYKGHHYIEKYHRQDFFFLNFVCQSGYDVLSSKFDNTLHLKEGDCYIGQPFSGYALRIDSEEEVIMVGLHIRKEFFYRKYLGALSESPSLFHFFLDPQTNRFSDEYIRLPLPEKSVIWSILYQMLLEYAYKKEDSGPILESLMLSLTLELSREYRNQYPVTHKADTAEEMVSYLKAHTENISLESLAKHFSYHPNYVSRYLPEKTGKTFSELVLEARMEKAKVLLSHTDLTNEEIASLLGYSNTSNFYKAFRGYYGVSPRRNKK